MAYHCKEQYLLNSILSSIVGPTPLHNPSILNNMYINIALRVRDLDTNGRINRETRHLFKDMLALYAGNYNLDHVTNQSMYTLPSQV